MVSDVKPWGRWATLGLGLIALLAGQLVALTALIWWTRLGLAHWADFARDGVAVTSSSAFRPRFKYCCWC